MKLVTLQCHAPVAFDAAVCRLCDAAIAGRMQDHLLVGQPGTTRLEATICHRCGEALRCLIDAFGPELTFVVLERAQPVHGLIGGPAERSRAARKQGDATDEAERSQLQEAAQHVLAGIRPG